MYAQHNLATDAGFNEFHLILSRDLGLTASVRDRVHELFFHSLVRFGVLALGQIGSLEGTPHAFRYRPLVDGAPIYQRGR